MNKDQVRQLKLLCYINWLLTNQYKSEAGVRDIEALKSVVLLPGGGSLTCLLGEKLSNRKDLYSQLGWFVYYIVDGEPFNSQNRQLALLTLIWNLKYYQLGFNVETLRDFIQNLDTMRQGNSDISLWLSEHCS
jgi:hypothetical protein